MRPWKFEQRAKNHIFLQQKRLLKTLANVGVQSFCTYQFEAAWIFKQVLKKKWLIFQQKKPVKETVETIPQDDEVHLCSRYYTRRREI